ncbi:MAG: hypothetical protein WB779_15740 [Ignavibacteriaceae bacterium]
MKNILFLLIFSAVLFNDCFASSLNIESDSTEIYLLDSYIAPEKPTIFIVSFITSNPAKAKLYIDNKYEFAITDTLSEDHKSKIDLGEYDFSKKTVPFYIIAQDSAGNKSKSDTFDLDFPKQIKMQKESNFILFGVFFGIQFLVPTPSYVHTNSGNYFALNKEIPLISFRSSSIDYPSGYFSIEYSHIYHADASNFFRLGYKHLFVTPVLKYISPGVDLFTNFDGYNGYSLEVSFGMFDLLKTFTVYSRYRFNSQPSSTDRNFHEISIGVFSNYFSFHF